MSGFVVRRATRSDDNLVAEFERRARLEATNFRGSEAYLSAWTGSDGRLTASIVLIAVDDRTMTATGALWLAFDSPSACVRGVFVLHESRGLGCGRTLLLAAMDESRTAGTVRIDGLALPGDRMTKNLYERVGMSARLITASTDL